MTRRQARENAFIIIFEKSFNEEATIEEIIETAAEARVFETDDFCSALALKVYEKLEEIDAMISKHLIGWKKDRISRMAISILRLAICEILFFPEIPGGVSINEAVELAKTYASEDDAPFINGVLSSVVKEIGGR